MGWENPVAMPVIVSSVSKQTQMLWKEEIRRNWVSGRSSDETDQTSSTQSRPRRHAGTWQSEDSVLLPSGIPTKLDCSCLLALASESNLIF